MRSSFSWWGDGKKGEVLRDKVLQRVRDGAVYQHISRKTTCLGLDRRLVPLCLVYESYDPGEYRRRAGGGDPTEYHRRLIHARAVDRIPPSHRDREWFAREGGFVDVGTADANDAVLRS